jgi:secreted trypsin-like serine protease
MGVKQMGTVRLRRCPRRVPALGLQPGDLVRALCWRARPWEQDTCHGDSGGPLLVGGVLAGVTSGGDANCSGFLSWDTSVVPFRPWIVSLLR